MMVRPWVRRLPWPDTVLGRTMLVMLAVLILSVVVGAAPFVIYRQEALQAIGGRNAAERVGGLVAIAEQTPPGLRQAALRPLDGPRFRVGWGSEPVVREDEGGGLSLFVRETLQKGIEGHEIRVSTRPFGRFPENDRTGRADRYTGLTALPPPDLDEGPIRGQMAPPHPPLALRIAVRLADQTWLNVMAPLDPIEPLWRPRLLWPLLMGLVTVTVVGLLAVRKATLPFAHFASAAERLGVDVEAPPLQLDGPREVRRAAHAFNVMQARILRFVQDRTLMLAAISHDLKTPITRLRLRAEFIDDDEQRLKMLADLDEMEQMIAATLAFARDDAASETRLRIDLATLVQGMVDDIEDMGGECRYVGPDNLVTVARPVSLKRAISNLLTNAIKYGHRARVGLGLVGEEIRLVIEDDGPGIPEDQIERVFTPFVRLESSRSRDTGGTGLGLSAARAAILAHGGDIILSNRPEGGLKVTVCLPRG